MSLPYQSQLSSFDEFLRKAGAGFSPLHFMGGDVEEERNEKNVIILIEEIPNLHTRDAEESFSITNKRLTE